MTPIDVARVRLGQREIAPNQGPIVTWSVDRWTRRRPDETGWARWCAGFACTCLEEGGHKAVREVGTLLVSALWENCTAHGWSWLRLTAKTPAKTPPLEAGDLVFFRRLHHVGLLERVDDQGRLVVISGNYKDAVARSYHRPAEIHGFARIPSISPA